MDVDAHGTAPEGLRCYKPWCPGHEAEDVAYMSHGQYFW